MTVQPDTTVDKATLTIDGFEITVPQGTLIIRAAEQLGIQIPRFCDHPLLDPVGACRQCIVEIEGQRKPVVACSVAVADGMAVRTQFTSKVADKAQKGTMELLLINHPLDCPVCDKGGECPLQNQAMSNGRSESRFRDVKRTYAKPLAISSQVLLDRERCVLCARCTRFSNQVAGDPFIELFERGALEQVAIYEDEPFESYFSGNTVQICPVGALTGAAYRFRARPFDLMSTPSVCEHCASGCAQRTDWRRGKVMRRLAGEDPEVNEEWNCDKGRWAFSYATEADRILTPLVRDEETGELTAASWPEALERAAAGLRIARDAGGVGMLCGGRVTLEDAYAYAKFARVVLGSNDVDMRARAHSAEELEFLTGVVAGHRDDVTYADLEAAPAVLLVGFEPEEESPIVFLRLRRLNQTRGLAVFAAAPFASPGTAKLNGTVLLTPPGSEPRVLAALGDGSAGGPGAAAASAMRRPGAVILIGERAAEFPGTFAAATSLAQTTGARMAWVPRRAGERGAVEAGALPSLLPGGVRADDAFARTGVLEFWGVDAPAAAGRDTAAMLSAAREGALGGLVVGGVDPADLPDPATALAALDAAGFVLSLEIRHSAVTERADVVLPVAPAVHKSGSYLTWEGRHRPFEETLRGTGALADGRVLHALADELDVDLALPTPEAARAELMSIGRLLAGATKSTGRLTGGATKSTGRLTGGATNTGSDFLPIGRLTGGATNTGPDFRSASSAGLRPDSPELRSGQALLASWRLLLDEGSLQDGEPHLAGTARRPVLRLSVGTAREIGASAGDLVTVTGAKASITLPLVVTVMPDRVVWVPMKSPGSAVRAGLGSAPGDVVAIAIGRPVN
ncbi:MAG: NADH-quinone oxidoreductase subunit G [Geodermatophilaceae bacterium]|nr:NADH-quinone oxidoreductase subunit G [Geodermatophilaceae bacterium]